MSVEKPNRHREACKLLRRAMGIIMEQRQPRDQHADDAIKTWVRDYLDHLNMTLADLEGRQ